MKSDVNACSTCPVGQEQYEFFTVERGRYAPFSTPRERVQYDYRHTNGRLFSTVAPDLITARARRDAWLATQEGGAISISAGGTKGGDRAH